MTDECARERTDSITISVDLKGWNVIQLEMAIHVLKSVARDEGRTRSWVRTIRVCSTDYGEVQADYRNLGRFVGDEMHRETELPHLMMFGAKVCVDDSVPPGQAFVDFAREPVPGGRPPELND
jgi:hypothetical protein